MLKKLFLVYRIIFIRKQFYKFNRFLYELGLRGLGIRNHETDYLSGEKYFLSLLRNSDPLVVIDVGANIGGYSENIKKANPKARIYAIEPQPGNFDRLAASAREWGYDAINTALGDQEGRLKLYDYADSDGSQHASLYKDVIEDIHNSEAISHEVDVQTLDVFVKENGIAAVDLLKIDVEGNEHKVLLGAKQTIACGIIDLIHFEFNEMNVVSRTFFKDFYDLLEGYRFYRMLPNGLIDLGQYKAYRMEIFAYQNIVAIRHSSRFMSQL